MKILLLNNTHERRGGADIVYLNTGSLLEKNGHDVIYFSKLGSQKYNVVGSEFFIKFVDYFSMSSIKKLMAAKSFFYSTESVKSLTASILKYRPDVAHVHLYKGTLTPAVLGVLRFYRIPIVITLHDFGFLCPHNIMLDGKLNVCSRCLQGSSFNCVIHKCNRNNLILSTATYLEFLFQKNLYPFNEYFDKIIVVSGFSEKMHLRSKIFSKKLVRLYNFYPNLDNEEVLFINGNYILYFGRISSEKGLDLLISAWLMKTRTLDLIIVGSGDLLDSLISRTKHIDSISFLDFKTGDELSSLIHNSKFVVVPSICYENNPLVIIESYGKGKPVIGSDLGGITEIIQHGETGFLFEPASAIDLSLQIDKVEFMDDAEYNRMSSNARKFADDNFSEVSHYESLCSIYQKAIEAECGH
jgi:glycosyltransferase involved in cell wall biosynthesis